MIKRKIKWKTTQNILNSYTNENISKIITSPIKKKVLISQWSKTSETIIVEDIVVFLGELLNFENKSVFKIMNIDI